jgi:hypothetical protein
MVSFGLLASVIVLLPGIARTPLRAAMRAIHHDAATTGRSPAYLLPRP